MFFASTTHRLTTVVWASASFKVVIMPSFKSILQSSPNASESFDLLNYQLSIFHRIKSHIEPIFRGHL